MNMHFIFRLRSESRGSVAIEFALLGGFMIALLLGVLQVGIGMQRYNSLRDLSADVARYAVVEYQKGNEVTRDQIWKHAHDRAGEPPYNISGDRTPGGDALDVYVTRPLNQRVDGATELDLTIIARIPSVLSIVGFESFPVTHSRPIFLIEE